MMYTSHHVAQFQVSNRNHELESRAASHRRRTDASSTRPTASTSSLRSRLALGRLFRGHGATTAPVSSVRHTPAH